MPSEGIDVKLAVYTERLDSYIESQTELNRTISLSLEKFNNELDEIKHWRTRIYGAKAASFVISMVFVHTAVILGSLVGIMTWFSND